MGVTKLIKDSGVGVIACSLYVTELTDRVFVPLTDMVSVLLTDSVCGILTDRVRVLLTESVYGIQSDMVSIQCVWHTD